jgi:elongation factor G
MADKLARKATSSDLAVSGPDRIRNVVLVGPTQSGKTSLVDALRRHTGSSGSSGPGTNGSGDQHRSVALAVTPVLRDGVKINLVDTPGYADFIGELRAGLRAADCALFVIAANDGVDEGTRQLWRECSDVSMPRAVVVTKLDHARADADVVVAAAQAAFGGTVLPLHPPGHPRRSDLIEAVIEESEDESLMDRYLDGEQIDEDALTADLEKAVCKATFHPVVSACAHTGEGLDRLLDLCVRGFPSPPEHPPVEVFTPDGVAAGQVTCDPDGPLVAEVVHTASDPYVGRVSLVRVFSGTLDPEAPVHVSGHFAAFFGTDGHPSGQAPAALVVAGDIAAVGRLSRAETGDTLSSPEQPLVLRPWTLPEPLLPVAIEAASRSDEDKLSSALARLAAEDPSLRVQHHPETGQLVIWAVGESHAEVALQRLRERYGVAVEERDVVIPLRECFTTRAKGHGRHVKQSGGHGQYAICDLEVEPLPPGGGFEFVDKVVGGAVPRQFIPSVEKGVLAQMHRGVRAGYPLVDLRVTLVDGKAHSVDSSDVAFQTAAAVALREAATDGQVSLLEPYDEVAVTVPDELVGTVMSDLSSRRGRLIGTDQSGDGRTVVRAHVPQRELLRYPVDLRATTHGAGALTRTFAHYEPMPEELARQVAPRTT